MKILLILLLFELEITVLNCAEFSPLIINDYEGQSKSSWTICIACKLFDAIRQNLHIWHFDASEINL